MHLQAGLHNSLLSTRNMKRRRAGILRGVDRGSDMLHLHLREVPISAGFSHATSSPFKRIASLVAEIRMIHAVIMMYYDLCRTVFPSLHPNSACCFAWAKTQTWQT